MKAIKWLFIAVAAIGITACSGSKSDSEKQDSAAQNQTVSTVEATAPSTPEPETFVVNGKEIQLTKGLTTRAEVIKMLGEADMELEKSLRYNWHEDGKFIQYTFYFFSDNDTFTKAEKASMQSSLTD